jgi:large subunit ribosomal protein L32
MRRAHEAIVAPNLRPCPKCGVYAMPHRVCPECGYYKNELVVEKKVKISD